MIAYIAFTKKEIYEAVKTYKLLIITVIFMIFGFMNPIVAKFTPMLLKNFIQEGMSIEIPEPTVIDSWMQFFKNVNQMGLIILVIMFSGIISNEISKNTLVNMLTKGLSRRTVILSKFTATSIIWTGVYYLAFLITFYYSKLFWNDSSVDNLLFSVSLVWIFGIFIISLLILGGTLFKTSYGSMVFCGIVVFVLLMLKIIPSFDDYNIIQLVYVNVDLINKVIEPNELVKPICITIILTVGAILSSIISFSKSKL